MARAKYRQLIEDNTFDEQKRLVIPDCKRLDEILRGVTWAISNYAEEFEVIDRTLRVAFTDPFPDAPALRIFFSIKDDNNVTLHWIELLPPDEDEDEVE